VKVKLRQWRLEKILTQQELAQLSGVSEASISKIEAGRQDARISTVRKLAKALGIEPTDLVDRETAVS
jgi:transcriptional regulator with XRE-family HTH domain